MSPSSAKRPTIEDVARAAGVSRQTVSRAINDKGEIDPRTRERVLEAARALDYRPNRFARGMMRRDTLTLGMILPNLTNPFFPEVADGVMHSAEAAGAHVVMVATRATEEGELAALDLIDRQTDGFVGYLHHPAALAKARQLGIPFSVFGWEAELPPETRSFNRVDIDFRDGAAQILAHLTARGHTRIGMLDLGRDRPRSPRGLLFGELAAPLTPGDHTTRIVGSGNSIAGGQEAMGRLLDAHPDTTAVITYNDVMAVGALLELERRNLSAPQDCAVVGCDGLILSEITSPPLTTLHIDKNLLGARSVEQVVAQLADPARPAAHALVRPELIVRASS
ncbi:LacI family DNA-binding transcriptional regulator [Kitasatospora sp. NPDC048239]|uniref:LacI family DNA-binding transcriptional regulator n=1 Tax=Kitasatospora sp. NPDC048239 TaxID=3364046 RepID=UPI003720D036